MSQKANPLEEVVAPLIGEADVSFDRVSIYCGDCTELMRKLPADMVDLTITSPPYNIGKPYEKPMPLDEYIGWCEAWINEIHRITKPDGAFWLNLGYLEVPERAKAVPIAYLLWDHIPFYILQELVWHYGAGVSARRTFSPRNEKWLWCVKDPNNYTFNLDDVRDKNVKYPNQKKHGKLRCNPLGKNPGDVWIFPKVTSGKNRSSKERTAHPSQFPIAVVDRIVKASSKLGDLVMDPFMGSGSTAESCLRASRYCLGFEILGRYVQITRERLSSYIAREAADASQGRLFQDIH